MSNKVIKAFRDKTDKLKGYRAGDTYSHEDDDRIAFLIKEGFLEEKSKQPPEEESKQEEKKKSPSKKKTDK